MQEICIFPEEFDVLMRELWNETLTTEYLGDPEVEVSDLLITVGNLLGNQPVLLKNIYQSYLRNEPMFTHKPMIGSALHLEFNYEKEQVEIKKLEQSAILTFRQFQKYMGLIDLLFSKIYPIGTVVELDETLLSDEIQQMFSSSELGLLVSIHGRRLLSEQEQEYIDYIGTIWPFGILEDVEPLFFNNFLIKRVVSEGMTNEREENFAETVLRKQLLERGALSSFYTREAKLTSDGGIIVGKD